jgi:DNA-binding NtrC family response regulator
VDDRRSGTWLTFSDGKPVAIQIRRCRLSVVSGPDAGVTKDFEQGVIRVGARRGNDLELRDPRVSGAHFEIRLDEHGYRLRDLESTNGTWVANHRVFDLYVGAGDSIGVGGTKLRFEPLDESVTESLDDAEELGEMIGRSAPMRALFARIQRVARADTTVLVTGETGAGKELVAEALHELSGRARGPFVVLDCGAIPDNLVESELFGHEKGAFTGATSAHAGAFERAAGGTLFLDEIGELPIELQPKLLRVLERREIRRVGGAKVIATDVRIVAATNRDLAVEVNRARFREDLFYRLAVATLVVPPLRDRKEDIPLLVARFLERIPGAAPLRPETLAIMARHAWPGNVRELRNVVERAAVLSETPAFGVAAIPAPSGELGYKEAKQQLVEDFERRYVTELLEKHGGNVSAAARAAGIDRMSIHKILNRLGIKKP